jgi:hypothetical protein
MQFKEALSKKALEEYGTLRKVIKLGRIEEPLKQDRGKVDLSKLMKEEVHDVMEGIYNEVYSGSNSIVLHY